MPRWLHHPAHLGRGRARSGLEQPILRSFEDLRISKKKVQKSCKSWWKSEGRTFGASFWGDQNRYTNREFQSWFLGRRMGRDLREPILYGIFVLSGKLNRSVQGSKICTTWSVYLAKQHVFFLRICVSTHDRTRRQVCRSLHPGWIWHNNKDPNLEYQCHKEAS